MLVVHDPRLIVLIAKGLKTEHRIPADVDEEGRLRSPKISPSMSPTFQSHPHRSPYHKVYVRAPHGRYGDKLEPPRLDVDVLAVDPALLAEMRDEDARAEGFRDLYGYRAYWNRYKEKKRRWFRSVYEPVWIVRFELHEIFQAGRELLDALEAGSSTKR